MKDSRYEEALERARAGMPIDEVFPELKESEDERIMNYIQHELACLRATEVKDSERYNELSSAIAYLERQKEQKPADWSEEDEKMLETFLHKLEVCDLLTNKEVAWAKHRLKSLRPQQKEEREPMEIKYGGKIYQVHGVRALPGGATGYIIEDEPGHYDCIINPEEVLGGGYGVKQNGSPYPTKEATFDQPHWKPSEEQMNHLAYACTQLKLQQCYAPHVYKSLESLYNDLQKLL